MLGEREIEDNLRIFAAKQKETVNNLRVLSRRQDKNDKIKALLAQALAECGEGNDLQEVKASIGIAVSKLNNSSKKTFKKFETGKQMIEQAKNKQKQWWDSIQAGLGIKPQQDLGLPEIKKEKENDSE